MPPTDPFPFLDHLDMAQVARVEALREKYTYRLVATHKVAAALGLTRERLDGYIARNPRKPREAA